MKRAAIHAKKHAPSEQRCNCCNLMMTAMKLHIHSCQCTYLVGLPMCKSPWRHAHACKHAHARVHMCPCACSHVPMRVFTHAHARVHMCPCRQVQHFVQHQYWHDAHVPRLYAVNHKMYSRCKDQRGANAALREVDPLLAD
eukprot:357234-Chlamydomonas_euryale.AAC.7